MKKAYIGRIKLTEKDSNEWYGKPPFMYVIDENENSDRGNINNAIMFNTKNQCEKALRKNFKEYRHDEFGSSMEILTLEYQVTSIAKII